MAPTGRGLWMQTRLIPCQCLANPYQTLPYGECNYTNRGCRQCGAQQYQDDLYARCTDCGSICPLGFKALNASVDGKNVAVQARYNLSSLLLCGPSIATSQDLAFADPVQSPLAYGVDQIKIGCVPCTAGELNSLALVVFVTQDCQWVCKRDATNQGEPDYYCKGNLSATTRVCNQQCLDCEGSLKRLLGGVAPVGWGWYIRPCLDGVGHSYDRCAPLADPNAVFTGNTLLHIGDSAGCPWACRSSFQLLRGRCVPCFSLGRGTCSEGEILQACTATSYYCAPCTLVMQQQSLSLSQAWYSTPDFMGCVADCEHGYSYRTAANDTCTLCNALACGLDQLEVPCARTADRSCVPCPQQQPPPNQEFYSPGTCQTRCIQGYYAAAEACLACASIVCSNGYELSSQCSDPSERLSAPGCVPCAIVDVPLSRPSPGRILLAGCAVSCRWCLLFSLETDAWKLMREAAGGAG